MCSNNAWEFSMDTAYSGWSPEKQADQTKTEVLIALILTQWGIITGPPWFLMYSLWTNRQKLIKFSKMSGRLCCYKQQQHSKLLAQFVFKVSVFHFNTCTKTRAPLPDCRINNALIHLVPSCQDTWTQFVDVLDLQALATLHSALSRA